MPIPPSLLVFGACASYAVYIIAGYPVLLSALARRRPQAIHRDTFFPSVSLILATHNGGAYLREKLDSIFALDYPGELLHVIVVDDGSTDDTQSILSAYRDRLTIVQSARTGKSGALNNGMARARHNILVFTDVRQVLRRDSLRLLMENFADPRVGAASAELQILPGTTQEEADTGAYWKYERWIRRNLSALDSIFGATGSYYSIRRELASEIPPGILNDDMFVPMPAFFKGFRLIVDARAKMFDFPTGLGTEFGRKVRTLAGNYQILRHFPQLVTRRNRLLLHYFSYKLGRLLLPFALTGCAISSLFIGGVFTWLSIGFQVVVYGLALCDRFIGSGSRLKRISSPLRSFLVMMLATACAISIWFVPPERLWKSTKVSQPRNVPA